MLKIFHYGYNHADTNKEVNLEFYWKKALEVSLSSKENGALVPLETVKLNIGPDDKKGFELRKLIGEFPKQIKYKELYNNPFKPYDKRLFIEKINSSHILILNKFPVQKGHMLLITEDKEPQDGWLSLNDFKALLKVDNDTSGLWFFNSSSASGASQSHRHLQLLPRTINENDCPRNYWFRSLIRSRSKKTILERSIEVIPRIRDESLENYKILYQKYVDLSKKLNIGSPDSNNKPIKPYNLLISKNWICLIRRSKEIGYNFNINGLGFAGYLLSTSRKSSDVFAKIGGEAIISDVVDPI